jgi:hypothetical protein
LAAGRPFSSDFRAFLSCELPKCGIAGLDWQLTVGAPASAGVATGQRCAARRPSPRSSHCRSPEQATRHAAAATQGPRVRVRVRVRARDPSVPAAAWRVLDAPAALPFSQPAARHYCEQPTLHQLHAAAAVQAGSWANHRHPLISRWPHRYRGGLAGESPVNWTRTGAHANIEVRLTGLRGPARLLPPFPQFPPSPLTPRPTPSRPPTARRRSSARARTRRPVPGSRLSARRRRSRRLPAPR